MKIISSTPKPDSLLSVATLNVWHGLSVSGKMSFENLESRRERLDRIQRQVDTLKSLNADIILLQEVNPLPFRSLWYGGKLEKRCYSATVNSGVKLGWGTPSNLSEGLTVLCPSNWECQFVGTKRLSGSFRLTPLRMSFVANPFFSFQLHESRSAMAVRVHLPKSRQIGQFRGATSVLIAVTHLHHEPAMSARTRTLLDDAMLNGMSAVEGEQLLEAFQAAEARRVSEIDILSEWLESVRKPGEAVILAGDLNSEPDSPAVHLIKRRGWIDSWLEAGKTTDDVKSATWDSSRNPLAHRGQVHYEKSKSQNPRVAEFISKSESLPRRIDYVFFQPWSSQFVSSKDEDVGCFGRLLDVKRFGYLQSGGGDFGELVSDDFSVLESKEPFGFAPGSENHFISDHYGLFATFGR